MDGIRKGFIRVIIPAAGLSEKEGGAFFPPGREADTRKKKTPFLDFFPD